MESPPDSRLLLVIPALNEAASIGPVVTRARQHLPQAHILVVDDGSGDDTVEQACSAGARVLVLPFNQGIGAAVQTGFIYAARYGYRTVLRSDGDGQHQAADLQRLLDALQANDVDMVVGTRFIENRGYRPPLQRRIGIILLARLISLIAGQRITDPTSGCAAFSHRAIELFAREYPHDYPEPEGLVTACRAGLRIREVPITMRSRLAGQSSISSLRSIYYMLKVTLGILISLLRPPLKADPV